MVRFLGLCSSLCHTPTSGTLLLSPEVQLGTYMSLAAAELWGALPVRAQGLYLEQTPWHCNMHRYPKFHPNVPLGLTSHLTLAHTNRTPAMLLFPHVHAARPHLRPLGRAIPFTRDALPLFHPWPAPSPHASLSHKVTAQGSFSRWNPSRSSPRLSPSLPRVSFSLNSYLSILSNPREPSIYTQGGKFMRAGRSCLFLLSPVPSTWHKAGAPRL